MPIVLTRYRECQVDSLYNICVLTDTTLVFLQHAKHYTFIVHVMLLDLSVCLHGNTYTLSVWHLLAL